MTFAGLCALCRELEQTRSRLRKIDATAQFLRELDASEVRAAVAFLAGRPLPASDPRSLDVSWRALSNAIRDAKPSPTTQGLTLNDVANAFAQIAGVDGPGSRKAKGERLTALFASASDEERELLARILEGEMRIGLHDGLILEAIARAFGAPVASVRRAAMFLSDLSDVAERAQASGASGLAEVGVRLFVPLLPMLAEPSEDFAEILAAHAGRTSLENKYDGARIQLHKAGPVARVWSRRLTEVTGSLPEVVSAAEKDLRGDAFILDGEVIAVNADGRPLPFQELMRRFRRIHEVETAAASMPIVMRFFDCLYAEGRALVDESYESRWKALERICEGRHLARRTVATDAAAADAFFRAALAEGHEGVVAKDLASPYTPGSRGKRWFKVKLAQTIDCVIIAADRGSGRRQGWLSNYHLAVSDGEGGFAPVGKTFKGFTDVQFEAVTHRLRALQTADDGHTVTVRPEMVVEIAYNEIQKSPQYRSGFALRFARITKIREDKGPGQATALSELRALYEQQFASKGRSDW